MIISTTTYFEDTDGNTLEVTTEQSGAVTVYSHDAVVRVTPDAVPALLAAVQHAADMAAASTLPAPAPEVTA